MAADRFVRGPVDREDGLAKTFPCKLLVAMEIYSNIGYHNRSHNYVPLTKSSEWWYFKW